MASKRRDLTFELAIAEERIRGLEAQIALLTKALEQSLSQPAVVYQGEQGVGPGFGLLAQRALANAEPDEPVAAPAPVEVKPTWFALDRYNPLPDAPAEA